jgi:cytoskeletal protein CcmA (bactofilin family)
MEVACPHCGHSQKEPRTAISTNCRSCGGHFLLEEVLKPARRAPKSAPVKKAAPERRKVSCFECGEELEVALTAQSTMCKRCSQYIDLKDYHIANAVSKNFKTKGSFALEPTGYVFNTEAIVGDAVIKGRFLGKLITEGSLTLYTTAEIKGSFKTARLIIPAANHFRWKEQIRAGSAEIAGELTANVRAEGTIVVRGTGRLFGDVEAGGLVVEDGAVVVGSLKIGRHG